MKLEKAAEENDAQKLEEVSEENDYTLLKEVIENVVIFQ